MKQNPKVWAIRAAIEAGEYNIDKHVPNVVRSLMPIVSNEAQPTEDLSATTGVAHPARRRLRLGGVRDES